jgi:O-methyltransferase
MSLKERARRLAFEQWLRATRPADLALYEKYGSLSQVRRLKFMENTKLVRSVTVAGDLVECGCWRGGMSAAMAEAAPGRRSVLFDSFEGLPDAGAQDGAEAHRSMAEGSLDYCRAPEAEARVVMERSGQRFEIKKGWFDDTVPSFAADRPGIAVLRLDGDWYDSTMVCLSHLFPLVPDDGLILIDDYGYWEGCTRAVHDYLAREQRPEPLQRARWGQTFMIKGGGFGALP